MQPVLYIHYMHASSLFIMQSALYIHFMHASSLFLMQLALYIHYMHAASFSCIVYSYTHMQPPAQAAMSLRMVIESAQVVETAIAYLLSRIVIRAMDVSSPQQFARVNVLYFTPPMIMIYLGCGGYCRHTN